MAIFILGPDSNGQCCTCADRINVCDTCTPATTCPCVLYIPFNEDTGVLGRYGDYATAASNLAVVATDCYVYQNANTTTTSFSLPDYVNVLVSKTGTLFRQFRVAVSITTSSSTLTATLAPSFSLGLISQKISIYQCTSIPVYPDTSAAMTLIASSTTVTSLPQNFTLPAAGTYVVVFAADGNGTNPSMNCRAGAAGSGQVPVINPVVAYYTDVSMYRPLEACPKMLLPPLTESTATWYLNLTEAQTAINTLTSNCIGYIAELLTGETFTAVFSGSTLTLTFNGNRSPGATPIMWASINMNTGDILTIDVPAYSDVSVSLYDYTGTLVASTSGAPPVSLSAAPYHGRYTLSVQSAWASPTATVVNITSSATLTVNNIQALYNAGLDCPDRLNC